MASNPQTLEDPVAAGNEALARGAWDEARDRFESALEGADSAEAWEGLSWAGWWLGEEELTLSARERAYRAYRAAGDLCAAARLAAWLASDFLDFRGEAAVTAGWLERARRLLDDQPECPEHGWIALVEADLAKGTGSAPEEVASLAREASRLGRAHGVADLEAVGLALEGQALVATGRMEEGRRRLDEASALAAGEDFLLALSPGWTLCCVISACEGAGDFTRARQWCGVMTTFAERWGGRHMMGMCRSAYGNVLATGGDWPAAESELTAAVEDLAASRPPMAAAGLVRLALLRARQGRAEEARALFERAEAHKLALIGLGQLALDRGDPASAGDTAERVLRNLPDSNLLDRVPALELQARACAALARHDEGMAALQELERTAGALGTPYLLGRAHLVRGELAFARDEHEEARRAAEDAVDRFHDGAAPYEAALSRLLLARALAELGRAAAAESELRAARETFSSLGAARDVERAESLLDGGSAAAGDGRASLGELTPRELDVLKLVAQGLSDAEIAERLVVSPHTVHRHVANVRTKLRLPSRAAAVAYAARAGLL